MKRVKRIISLLLVFTLLFSVVPVNALAVTSDTKETVGANQATDPTDETIVIEDLGPFDPTDSGADPTVEDTQATESTDVSGEETIPTDSSEFDILAESSYEYEATILGFVIDAEGNGLAGVGVTVYDITDEMNLYASCVTDASGTWQIEDAWIGDTYSIRYYKAGYELSSNEFRVTAISGGAIVETVTATKILGLVCNEADYTYTTDATKKTTTITGYTGSDIGIILPSELGEYPVTAIASDAFARNTTIVSVALSENITSIGSSAFSGCTGLKNVYSPNVLTHIHRSAFEGCTGIESMVLPDSVQLIGYRAFCNCTNLSDINIPLSWNSASSNYSDGQIFSGCSSLTSIVVPEGITALPDYAFKGADCLRTISLPESLMAIGNRAFNGCERLRVVIVPRAVNSIGSYAFANCDDLRYVMLLGTKCSIGENLFNNTTKAFLYCPWTSEASVYAIKNNIDFFVLEDEKADYSNYVVDMENTRFYTIANIAQVERYVPLTLNYSFANEEFTTLTNCKLVLSFTNSLSIAANSIFLNGTQVNMEDLTYKDNELTVPLIEQSGTLQLSVTPVEAGRMMSAAKVTYSKSGVNGSDTIGIVWLEVPMLTINAPSLISGSEFEVSGVTSANEIVSLSVNGEPVGSVVSKKNGTFTQKIDLPMTPAQGTAYTVTATLESNTSVSTSTSVTYDTDAPILTQFDMYYYGTSLKYLNLLDTQTKANSIWPSKPLKFVIHFDNADSVSEVFVTSTKNGIVNRMQAFATENAGEYIAEGFFDGTNSSYVPGTINIQYGTKASVEDYASDLDKEELPDAWINSTTKVLSNTENEYQANITLSNGDEVEFEVQENISIDELRSKLLDDEGTAGPAGVPCSLQAEDDDWEIIKDFFQGLHSKYKDNVWSNVENLSNKEDAVAVVKDDITQTLIYVFWDSAKDAFRSVGIKFLGTNWIYENSIGVSWKDSASAWGFIADGVNIIVHGYDSAISLSDAEADIKMSSTLTDEQKAYALEKVEQLRWGYAATGLLRIAAAVAGYGFTISGNPMMGVLVKTLLNEAANLAENYLDKSLAYYTAGGQGTYLKWILDPSGIVFDSETGEPIEKVTVTAYWIEHIDSDTTFLDAPPSSNEYGRVWNASEYSQQNPIQTDSAGSYAWDVPEGWWRVKYEKDGYEAVWSDWLPVPPPQTEVNIGMTRIASGSGVAVSGTVTSYGDSTGAVTIELIDDTGAAAYSTIVIGNSVSYALYDVAAGTYTMKVSKENHVTRSYTIVVKATDLSQDAKICLRGDVTGDGKITATDYSRLLAHVKKTNVITDEYTLLCADVTGEGKITATDYSRLLAHVKKVSLLW